MSCGYLVLVVGGRERPARGSVIACAHRGRYDDEHCDLVVHPRPARRITPFPFDILAAARTPSVVLLNHWCIDLEVDDTGAQHDPPYSH